MTAFHSGEHHDDELPAAASRVGFAIQPGPLLWRGLALGALSCALGRFAVNSLRTSFWLLPVALLLAGGAVIAAWASAIQLTGGVRHDDHPWI